MARLRAEPGEPALAVSDPDAWFVTKAFDAWNTAGTAGAAAWCSRWVVLEDPPGWPGAAHWRGREAAIERLDEVTTGLGGHWAEVTDARSVGDEVLVGMELRPAGGSRGIPVRAFHLIVEVQQGEITRLRVYLGADEALAAVGAGA